VRGTTEEWGTVEPSAVGGEAESEVEPAAPPQPERGEAETMIESASEGGRSHGTADEEDPEMPHRLEQQPTKVGDDWLDELDSSDTLDWPERPAALKMLDRRPAERRAARDRVSHLFPRPETTEWSVSELDYDRRRRRQRVRV
jgi:hypothetical protein